MAVRVLPGDARSNTHAGPSPCPCHCRTMEAACWQAPLHLPAPWGTTIVSVVRRDLPRQLGGPTNCLLLAEVHGKLLGESSPGPLRMSWEPFYTSIPGATPMGSPLVLGQLRRLDSPTVLAAAACCSSRQVIIAPVASHIKGLAKLGLSKAITDSFMPLLLAQPPPAQAIPRAAATYISQGSCSICCCNNSQHQLPPAGVAADVGGYDIHKFPLWFPSLRSSSSGSGNSTWPVLPGSCCISESGSSEDEL